MRTAHTIKKNTAPLGFHWKTSVQTSCACRALQEVAGGKASPRLILSLASIEERQYDNLGEGRLASLGNAFSAMKQLVIQDMAAAQAVSSKEQYHGHVSRMTAFFDCPHLPHHAVIPFRPYTETWAIATDAETRTWKRQLRRHRSNASPSCVHVASVGSWCAAICRKPLPGTLYGTVDSRRIGALRRRRRCGCACIPAFANVVPGFPYHLHSRLRGRRPHVCLHVFQR